MSKKSCDFLGSKEALIDVGNTKAMGLVVCSGTDKRVLVPEAFCMGLKGVSVWEHVFTPGNYWVVRVPTNNFKTTH